MHHAKILLLGFFFFFKDLRTELYEANSLV